jgi:hypothetical protein
MRTLWPFSILLSLLWAGLGFPALAADGAPTAIARSGSSELAGNTAKSVTYPVALTPFFLPSLPARSETTLQTGGVDWVGLSSASFRFLSIEHGFRLLTEPGTRSGLKGPFLRNYGRAVGNLHGWADGDEFYVNYVGHPMEGSAAGFLWAQNDRAYRRAEFGSSPEYWKGRLRAAAFAWAFSTQFEIGPLSEASIGAIQASFPQQGFVDHVITPTIGLAWMIGEDAVDKYVIKRIEAATTNPYVRFLVRCGLNPTRSFANVMQGRVPWNRETRPGVNSYVAGDERRYSSSLHREPAQQSAVRDAGVVAPFEFAVTFQPQRLLAGKNSPTCLGGGATPGFRLAPSWQLIVDVGGCKMMGLEKDLSGDSLTYLAGPRWISRIRGPWSAYLQFLAGGNKITEERMYPEFKQLLEKIAIRENKPPPSHEDYTEATESNGFAVATGGGLNYNLSPALSVRVADLSYRHAWTSPLWGRDYSSGVQFSSGLVLRMGTW